MHLPPHPPAALFWAKPSKAPESNWIRTVEGRNFLVALRLYGTSVEFFDQTWKPDDVVKVR